MKPVVPDAILAAILGSNTPIQRPQIVKFIWAHIKAHGLQEATDRRQINADETLRPLFYPADSVSMLELPKCIARHVTKVS